MHGGDGLDLKIGRHEEENNAAKCQSVNDRSEEVPRLVRREVLSEQGSHDWRLPEEQSVDEDDLEDALQVGHKHCQSEHHAQQDEQEYVQNHGEVLKHETQWQEVVDANAKDDRDRAGQQFGHVVLLRVVGESDQHATRGSRLQRVRHILA